MGMFSVTASAGENTTYTYTISVDNEWIRTQDAYMPSKVMFRGFGLSQPSDIFISGRTIYVADSGNARVVAMNLDTGKYRILGEGILQSPNGIFVKSDGTLYIADGTAKAVFILNSDGKLKKQINRPDDSPLFSSSSVFEPKNVAVTSQNNIFVVGNGAHEGIMQFNEDGVFQGFFAANKRNLTMLERIQSLVFTDEQKAQLLSRTSRPIENIDISDRDLICSVTQDAGVTTEWHSAEAKVENRIKLHNMAGVNILSPDEDLNDEWNFVDVAAGNEGQLYALTYTGVISEFDSQGNLLFSFGGRSISHDRNGLFTVAAAIDTDSDGLVYVLDKERAMVQVFYPTDYADVTHTAAQVLEKGEYAESEELWKSILDLNGMSRIAHIGYGKSLFHRQRFKEALNEFYIADDKEDYSSAFWEIRNEFLNKAMPFVIVGILLLYLLTKVIKGVFKKKNVSKNVANCRQGKLAAESRDALYMLRHPLDGFYDLKHGKRGSVLSATVIYVLAVLIFIADRLLRGYLFSTQKLSDASVISPIVMITVPLLLWVLGNSMVASLNDGEGSVKNMYIATAYSLMPYICITPFAVLLSYGVTYNESFILQLIWFIGVAWSGVLIVLGIMHTHNYTSGETVKNILLTVFFMLMAIIAAAIMYVMWKSLGSFFAGVFGEVEFRVSG